MELISGRLQGEAEPRFGAKIESDLVRCAWRRPGNRARKAAFDRAVEMTAKDSLDLRLASDDFTKRGGVA